MIKKSLLLFAVNVAGRGFQYLYRVIMSTFLPLKEFGVLSASLPYQSFVLLFTSMSVTPTASKFASEYKLGQKEKIFSTFSLLLLGIIMGTILYSSTGLFTRFFGAEFQGSESVLKILALGVPFAVLLSVCTGIFLGHERAGLVAFSLILYQVLMISFSYVLVQYTGLNGAAQGIFFGYFLSGVAAFLIVLRFGIPVKMMVREMVRILKFSLPVLAGVVGLWALLNVDILVLARFVTPEEVGLYGMAVPTAHLIFGFSAALSALLVPKVSELKYRGAGTSRSIESSFEVCLLVTLPITVTLAAFSREILYVLFGNFQGYASLQILSVGMLFYSLFFIGYSALQGLGHPERSMGIAVAAALFCIFLCFLLIPHFALMGAASATSLSCILGTVLTLFFLKIVFVPRMQYIIVMLPLFLFEHFTGILGSRLETMVVYSACGLPLIGIYLYLSRKYLHVRE